jgi:rhodanese-related sulfurtransferase
MSFFNRILACGSGCAKIDTLNISDLEKRQVVYLDVRTTAEYQSGHIRPSKNIPLQELGQHMAKLKALNVPIIAYCRSGKRSEVACTMLKAQQIECYNGGGYIDLQSKITEHKAATLA